MTACQLPLHQTAAWHALHDKLHKLFRNIQLIAAIHSHRIWTAWLPPDGGNWLKVSFTIMSASLVLFSCTYALDAAVLGYTSGPLGFCWPCSQISFSLVFFTYCCKVKALSNEHSAFSWQLNVTTSPQGGSRRLWLKEWLCQIQPLFRWSVIHNAYNKWNYRPTVDEISRTQNLICTLAYNKGNTTG